ncbi:MAG: hypothetical protein J6Y64_01955 [Ruminococcus sp.]|nr:hypothetical protein [Ruminococcus sp.]
MKKFKKILCIISAAAICTLTYSCEKNSSGESSSEVDILNNGAKSVVPSKTELIENTKAAGYEVSEFDNIYDLQVSGERVLAQKGNQYIDICYGLNKEDAVTVFKYFEDKYDSQLKSEDYYILARNQKFVYFISDKKTFTISGFKSIDNDGEQYISKE